MDVTTPARGEGTTAPARLRAPQWLIAWSDPWPPDASRARGLVHLAWLRLLVFAVTFAAVGTVVAAVASVAQVSAELVPPLVSLVGAVAGYLVLCRVERRWPPYELSPRRVLGLPAGLLLGVLTCSMTVGLLVLFGLREVHGSHAEFPVWVPLFQLGIAAGIWEEIVFRGVMFRMVEAGLGTWWATAISGLFFGAAHLFNPGATLQGAVAIAVEAGVMLALLYALTRSLWVVIGFHAAWNLAQGMVYGSVVSGADADQRGWLITSPAGPDWLSGGGFGVEASPITVLLLAGVAVACAVVLVRTGRIVPGPRRRRHATSPAGADPMRHRDRH